MSVLSREYLGVALYSHNVSLCFLATSDLLSVCLCQSAALCGTATPDNSTHVSVVMGISWFATALWATP